MSIFLDCFKNNGKDYLRIINSSHFKKENGKYSNKRKVIKNIGYLSDFDDGDGDGLLQRLREQFKNKTLDIGMNYEELSEKISISSDEIIIKNPVAILDPKNIGYFFIENIFNKMGISDVLRQYKSDSGIEYDLLGLTKLLVFGRILKPKSKKRTFEDKDEYLFPITTSKDVKEIYKALDILDAECNTIQTRMNTKINQSSVGRTVDVTYYDVTNYFIETSYPDEDSYKIDENGEIVYDDKGKPVILNKGIRKKGVCKKHSGKPIVSMGLLMDNNGIPVSYNLFPGNTHETTGFKETIVPALNKNSGKVVLVADNGMYDQAAQKLLVENGNGYIISKSVRESWNTKPKDINEKSLRGWAMDDTGYDKVFDKNKKLIYKSKSRIYKRILNDSDGSTTIEEKQVITWDIKYYNKKLHEFTKLREELEFYKNNPKLFLEKKKKYKKFIKILQIDNDTGEILNPTDIVVLLDKKIQKEKEILGYYSIISSETRLTDKEIRDKYRGLSRIEDSFRIIKTDLAGRPISVWTKEHINAHFLICFIALTIIRIMQYKVLKYQGKETFHLDGWEQGIAAERMKEALNNFNANKIGDGCYQISEIKDEIKLIIEALQIENKLNFPDLSRISGFKDKINSIGL